MGRAVGAQPGAHAVGTWGTSALKCAHREPRGYPLGSQWRAQGTFAVHSHEWSVDATLAELWTAHLRPNWQTQWHVTIVL